ncbi:hypothetical protein DPMN_021620 [Dreissena polymorpha]|uniref:C2H2-type domain-containing protein n=1 Tax=Dreissena polymorpha TaxID=45954 RepID=A0A9D4NPG4_DREPO|nr:hypothetical protein DPMN_021620 [Dreissena polymorpha]
MGRTSTWCLFWRSKERSHIAYRTHDLSVARRTHYAIRHAHVCKELTFGVHLHDFTIKNRFAGEMKPEIETYKEISRSNIMECKFCGKRFVFRSKFSEHLRTHTGEKPFECRVCGKSFSLNWNLKKHMIVHMKKDYI